MGDETVLTVPAFDRGINSCDHPYRFCKAKVRKSNDGG